MSKILNTLLFISIAIGLYSCGNKAEIIRAGSICTIDDGEGKFGIVKVLVINNEEAHIKIYKNKYDIRPTKVDLKTLGLGSINDKEGGFGIGHVPLEKIGFDNWKPMQVGFEEVTKEDLEGYEMWKNH
jgi:hypothetical protein